MPNVRVTFVPNKQGLKKYLRTDRGVKVFMQRKGDEVKKELQRTVHVLYFAENVEAYVPSNPVHSQVAIIRAGGGHPGYPTASFFFAKYRYMQKALRKVLGNYRP